MMLVGMALYKMRIATGQRSPVFQLRMGIIGVAAGTALAGAGVVWVMSNDFSPDVAFIGNVPNGFATIAMALGYLGLLSWWDLHSDGMLAKRLRALGQMALTNYIAQTVLGLILLGTLPTEMVTRSVVWGFILVVWTLQLWWSERWLRGRRYGPLEWLWRSATHRRWEPLLRRAT
jgi:uncharacterized protein